MTSRRRLRQADSIGRAQSRSVRGYSSDRKLTPQAFHAVITSARLTERLPVVPFTDGTALPDQLGASDWHLYEAWPGRYLAGQLHFLLERARSDVLCIPPSPMLQKNLSGVHDVLHRFFASVGDEPAEFWAHPLCWTNRAMARHEFGGDMVSIPITREPEVFSLGASVTLHYDARRTISGIPLATGRFEWVDGRSGCDSFFVKRVEQRVVFEEGQERAVSHRESLFSVFSAALAGVLGDPVSPAVRRLTRPLFQRSDGRLTLQWHRQEPSQDAGGDSHLRCLDDTGILDAVLLRGIHLVRPRSLAVPGLRVREVTFALTRLKGELLHVVAVNDTEENIEGLDFLGRARGRRFLLGLSQGHYSLRRAGK